ncbi:MULTISPECIES: cell division protein ZipA [Vibrio]|uniref:Cell division protein ZipA n=1 Tax=Vibrio diazotrophicus TaxID=685 RepID=A0A329EDF3_VIBDI|nr:cell division protein ZipA [Vibrio diazotrophicus]PNH98238.1 cell division protein ZipA [Vibrio diazotrophicus]PNH99524.1 cell division protein ZipA [Vibrio diazotrophicus]RAS67751.1 cell division protein ZipA [Vibrio diazotrophicus]
MQELRFVLIIVGALAIAALLFHGLWTSKKEGKSKFGDKPLGKLEVEQEDTVPSRAFAPEDDYEIIRKDRKEPDFGLSDTATEADPLISDYEPTVDATTAINTVEDEMELDVPSMVVEKDNDEAVTDSVTEEQPSATDNKEPKSDEMEVIVLNVHCAGNEPFVGTKLFDSMQQNGLLYGEMDIFHRHADMSGTGKVLFSVANMMQPGTLKHDDPAEFTTKGISFFMTLPCFGDPAQNFKLMLKTAQQIADDLSGNVLDDARNMMTPDRLDAYRKQIQDFKIKAAQQ